MYSRSLTQQDHSLTIIELDHIYIYVHTEIYKSGYGWVLRYKKLYMRMRSDHHVFMEVKFIFALTRLFAELFGCGDVEVTTCVHQGKIEN